MFFNSRPSTSSSIRLSILSALATFTLVATVLVGCDRYMHRQSPAKSDQVELKTDALTCLHPVPERIGRWLHDELSVAEIETTFSCFHTTVSHFEEHARGKHNSENLQVEDLQKYINQALPSDRQLNDELMAHLMKLKTVFFGGDAQIMTREELHRVARFLDVAETQVKDLTGWMRILLFQEGKHDIDGKAQPSISIEQLHEAERRLKNVASVFLEKTFISGSSYGFQDLSAFVNQFDEYLGHPPLLAQFIRWLPFTQSLKDLLVGHSAEFSSANGWKEHVEWLSKAYNSGLEYFYLVRPLTLEKPKNYDVFIGWTNQLVDVVGSSRVMRERGVLGTTEILAMVDRFLETGALRTSIETETLKRILPETICRGLANFLEGPQTRALACHEVDGLTAKGFSILKFEWNVWAVTQRQLQSAFKDSNQITYGDLRASVLKFKPSEGRAGLPVSPTEQAYVDRSFSDWKSLMLAPYPMLWGPNQRLIVKPIKKTDPVSFTGMSEVNLFRSLTRMVLRGYGVASNNDDVFDYKLRQTDLERLEYDFRDFGRAIHFLDPRNPNPGGRTFQEASFFTPHGKGADTLSGEEIFEELNILVSAGGQTANAIYDRIVQDPSCKTPDLDVFGKFWLRQDCTMAVMRNNFSEFFASVPGLLAMHYETIKDGTRDAFDRNLLDLARLPDNTKKRPDLIGFGEIRTMATVLYYIEMLRLVYDENGDGKLSLAEVKKAQPRFYSFISALIKQEKIPWYVSSWKTVGVEDIFPCLVFEQKKPGVACVLWGPDGGEQIGLPELLKVLGVLKAAMPK